MNASLEYLSSEHPSGSSSSALVPYHTNLDLGMNRSSQAGYNEGEEGDLEDPWASSLHIDFTLETP